MKRILLISLAMFCFSTFAQDVDDDNLPDPVRKCLENTRKRFQIGKAFASAISTFAENCEKANREKILGAYNGCIDNQSKGAGELRRANSCLADARQGAANRSGGLRPAVNSLSECQTALGSYFTVAATVEGYYKQSRSEGVLYCNRVLCCADSLKFAMRGRVSQSAVDECLMNDNNCKAGVVNANIQSSGSFRVTP